MRTGARVWVTRARPGAERTAARLTALGFAPQVVPLLEIAPLSPALDLTGVDALAFTSVNAVTAFSALTDARALPVFAVGDATAEAARVAGFASVRSASGALGDLAALIRADGRGRTLLHPGAVEPAGDLSALVGPSASVRALPIYEAREAEAAPPDVFDAVLIHSPRAARVLAARLSPDAAAGSLAVALSQAAAQPLVALRFREIRVAPRPTEDALLATLGNPAPDV